MKMSKRLISFVLAAVMLLSGSLMLTVSASAANYIVPEEGTYAIYCNNYLSNLVLNVQYAARGNANIVLDTMNCENNELWILRKVFGGYVTLSPLHASNYYLSGKKGYDQGLTLDTSSFNYYSQWRVYKNNDETVTLVNRKSGYAIDVSCGHHYVGNKVLSYSKNGYADAQNWHLSRISETSTLTPFTRVTLSSTSYYAITFGSTNQALNVQYASTRIDGSASIVLDPYNGERNEIFKFVNRGNNRYSIHPLHDTSLCLNAYMANPHPGHRLSLYKYSDGDEACLWEIYRDGNYFCFRNVKTKLFIDSECCRSTTGNPILTYSYNGCSAQKFKLKAVEVNLWQYPLDNAYCSWTYAEKEMSWGCYTVRDDPYRRYHLALDLKGSNSNVYAASDGKVVACSSSNSGANGRYVIIEHNISGKTVYSFYAHLSSVSVKRDQIVSMGTQIGIIGGSGNGSETAYKTHLHFAIVDTLVESGGYYGYSTYFTGNVRDFNRVRFYNPKYVIEHNELPSF